MWRDIDSHRSEGRCRTTLNKWGLIGSDEMVALSCAARLRAATVRAALKVRLEAGGLTRGRAPNFAHGEFERPAQKRGPGPACTAHPVDATLPRGIVLHDAAGSRRDCAAMGERSLGMTLLDGK